MLELTKDGARVGAEATVRLALAKSLKRQFAGQRVVFASEARYGASDRRADFLAVGEDSHAFEIKSDSDSLDRLSDQVSDYVASFDFVSIVTSDRHLNKVKNIVPPRVGLWLYSNNEVTAVRPAKRNKRLSKLHLAKGCSKSSLMDALSVSNGTEALPALQRSALKRLRLTQLRALFLAEMKARYTKTSNSFLSETDGELDVEDLLLLKRVVRIADRSASIEP